MQGLNFWHIAYCQFNEIHHRKSHLEDEVSGNCIGEQWPNCLKASKCIITPEGSSSCRIHILQ